MVTVQEQFSNFPNTNPIIATTYNFDYKTVRDLICPRRNVHERSIILADRKSFAQEKVLDYFNQGLTHYIYPANITGHAFHLKVALAIDDDIIRLLVGSHNLTEYGTKYNLEITGFYEIPLVVEYAPVITELASFLEGLAGCISSDMTTQLFTSSYSLH